MGRPLDPQSPFRTTGDDGWRGVPVAKSLAVKDNTLKPGQAGLVSPVWAARLGEGKPRNQTRGRSPRLKNQLYGDESDE